jgi:hypothetical protein
MFVEFQKCRMDYAATSDEARPMLTLVYLDLERKIMWAADGFTMVVKRIRVEEGTEDLGETVIGIPKAAMAWLMTARGQDVQLFLERAGDKILVSRDDRQTVAVTGDNLHPKCRSHEVASSVAEHIVKREHIQQAMTIDLRKFHQIRMATGQHMAAIAIAAEDTDTSKQPYLIAQTESAAIVMPVHMEGHKQIGKSLAVLSDLLGPGEQEVEDEGTVQDP